VNKELSRRDECFVAAKHSQDFAYEKPQPLCEAAEVETGGCEDGIDAIAFPPFQEVPSQPVLLLEMTDDRFDRGTCQFQSNSAPAFQLQSAPNGFRQNAHDLSLALAATQQASERSWAEQFFNRVCSA
jgi:hypothetical protein